MSVQRSQRIFLSPPHIGGKEQDFVREAFESNYIAPLGPMADAFEREFAEYAGIPHCLALASGTAAMHLALRELGVGPGDEVLASTLTFIGSVSPATFLGASVAFIDSDEQTWNMDPALLADELVACARGGKLPKAVIPTDLYGQCCDLERIKQVCERYEIAVVADAAEAMGARYKTTGPRDDGTAGPRDYGTTRQQDNETASPVAGSHVAGGLKTEGGAEVQSPKSEIRNPKSQAASEVRGPVVSLSSRPQRWVHAGYGAKAAVFSFNGNKIMTTSGGGMLASQDGRLIEHARKLSQQARDSAPHYEHSEIGYNYRMSNILAAIGRGQLRVLDERVAAKRRIFEQYRQLLGDLPGITFMPESPYGRCNRWLTVILIDRAEFGSTPEQVRLALEAENIESRPIWKPMHLQPVFSECRVRSAECGVEIGRQAVARRSGKSISEDLFARGLCLPSGTAMGEGDVERVGRIIRRCGKARSESRKEKGEMGLRDH
jgi:dTDP-4-amino-4,6-dideoxygalactose transaminase